MGLLDLLPSSPALWIAGAALAGSLAFAGAQTLRLAELRTKLAEEQRAHAVERATLETAGRIQAERFRNTEQRWQEAQHENETIARKARDLAAAHADLARAADGRLQQRAAAVAAACRPPARSPGPVAASPAASAPGDLLADVLVRMGGAARQLASYADAAGIAGEQCAADYEALRQGPAAAESGAVARRSEAAGYEAPGNANGAP